MKDDDIIPPNRRTVAVREPERQIVDIDVTPVGGAVAPSGRGVPEQPRQQGRMEGSHSDPVVPGRILDRREAAQLRINIPQDAMAQMGRHGRALMNMGRAMGMFAPGGRHRHAPGGLRERLAIEGPRQGMLPAPRRAAVPGPQPENLPAVRRQQDLMVRGHGVPMAVNGPRAVSLPGQTNPEWVKVADLPAPAAGSPVAVGLGRMAFSEFTEEDPLNIICLSSVTHDPEMVRNVAGWAITEHRREYGNNGDASVLRANDEIAQRLAQRFGMNIDADLDAGLEGELDGYEARIMSVVARGVRYIIVRDFMADYVYAYPDAWSRAPALPPDQQARNDMTGRLGAPVRAIAPPKQAPARETPAHNDDFPAWDEP